MEKLTLLAQEKPQNTSQKQELLAENNRNENKTKNCTKKGLACHCRHGNIVDGACRQWFSVEKQPRDVGQKSLTKDETTV